MSGSVRQRSVIMKQQQRTLRYRSSVAGRSLAAVLVLVSVAGCTKHVEAPPPVAKFSIEEATIAGIHDAIKSGATTCTGIVEAYIERAKAYNGVCTALITPDVADIPATTGYVRAGSP